VLLERALQEFATGPVSAGLLMQILGDSWHATCIPAKRGCVKRLNADFSTALGASVCGNSVARLKRASD
jgi:hypothetical protein